jgi:hypothetical protein
MAGTLPTDPRPIRENPRRFRDESALNKRSNMYAV